jgi:hypothetical protein
MFVGTVNISAFVVTRMAAMGAEIGWSGGGSEYLYIWGDNDTIGQELVIISCMHLNTTHPHFCKRDLVPSTYINAVDHTVL